MERVVFTDHRHSNVESIYAMTNGLWTVILQDFLWIRLFGFILSIYWLFSITYICLSRYSVKSSESIGVMQVTQCLKLTCSYSNHCKNIITLVGCKVSGQYYWHIHYSCSLLAYCWE